MTAIVVAMLGSVLLATAILVVVAFYHELTRSASGRRWIRRRRRILRMRAVSIRGGVAHGLRLSRRAVAARLTPSTPTPAR